MWPLIEAHWYYHRSASRLHHSVAAEIRGDGRSLCLDVSYERYDEPCCRAAIDGLDKAALCDLINSRWGELAEPVSLLCSDYL